MEKARVLNKKEVLLLPLGKGQWFEFKFKDGRTEISNPFLLKGHITANRMLEYGITWRIWSEKPDEKKRIITEWITLESPETSIKGKKDQMEKNADVAALIETAIQGKAKDDTVALKVKDVEDLLRKLRKGCRLLTIQEVKKAPLCTIMWEEIYDEAEKQRVPVRKLVPYVSRGDGTLVDIHEGKRVYIGKDYYDTCRDINGLIYKKRFWSEKPTIEQCKATQWAETPVHQEDYSYV
jgi:hypothetical protein